MFQNLLVSICLLLSFQLNSQSLGIDSLRLNFEHYSLDNGLQVVLQPDREADRVSIEFWLVMGSSHEETDQYGLVHFYEHVTPYGLQGKEEKRSAFRELRTDGNAQTRKDFTRYFLEFKPEGLDVGLEYASDRLQATPEDILAEKVEKERERVLDEIERQSKYAFWSANGSAAVGAATFGRGHPYAHGAYGEVANNRNFSLQDFRDWHARYMGPDNALLFIVGNFEMDRTKELIRKYFGKIKSRNLEPQSPDFSGNFSKPQTQEVGINSAKNQIALVMDRDPWGSGTDPNFTLLTQVMEVRLKQNAENNAALIEGGSEYLDNAYKHGGQFGIYASFGDRTLLPAVRVSLKSALDEVLQKGISEEELVAAKKNALATFSNKMERLGFYDSRTELLGEGLLYKGDPGYYLQRLHHIEGVQLADFNDFLSGLNPKELKEVVYWSSD